MIEPEVALKLIRSILVESETLPSRHEPKVRDLRSGPTEDALTGQIVVERGWAERLVEYLVHVPGPQARAWEAELRKGLGA